MGKVIGSIKNGLFGSVFIAILLHMLPSITIAQDYPIKPLRLVVPYPPGGAVDLTARLLSQRLAQALGQTIVIDNRPGAAGHLGAEQVSKASADGYTLLYTVGAELAMRQSLPGSIDLLRDLTPIASVAASVSCIVARPNLPLGSMQELLELARRNPGKLSFGSPGNGSSPHLAAEMMKAQSNTFAVHVPYRGAAPAMQDLLAGQIDFMFDPGIGLQHVRSGKLKMLGVGSLKRSPLFPDVPTLDELGLKGFDADSWFGFYAPAGTPAEVVQRLNREINAALATTAVKDRIQALGGIPAPMSAADFGQSAKTDSERFGQLIKTRNIRGD